MHTEDEFYTAILTGRVDAGIDRLERALDERRKALARRVLSGLNPGDTVRFTDKVRPRYLIGATASVVRVNNATAVVRLTSPVYGPRYRGEIRVPATLLEAP